MKYKLSNVASRTRIEELTKLPFKYANIYKPKRKIDGTKEQNVSIITMENPGEIIQGIWGMLPQNYEDHWNKFQQIKSTLHTCINDIYNNVLYKEALFKRRCLLIVTGFYAHKLLGNKVENYLVEKENREPFYLAGIYNTTEDGFYTCTVINTNATEELNSINNLYETMPLQIPQMFKNKWLDKNTTREELAHLVSKPYHINFCVQKIIS
ncbi:SOS response-associated peptidase family protein [Tenacibaculum sp. TC6]|uniref:SOS response-associated peptidase family protein n=1 Tax=Tenacibaculum sp. TC6 TaxID=3423223 RepID=UPI003D3674B4